MLAWVLPGMAPFVGAVILAAIGGVVLGRFTCR